MYLAVHSLYFKFQVVPAVCSSLPCFYWFLAVYLIVFKVTSDLCSLLCLYMSPAVHLTVFPAHSFLAVFFSLPCLQKSITVHLTVFQGPKLSLQSCVVSHISIGLQQCTSQYLKSPLVPAVFCSLPCLYCISSPKSSLHSRLVFLVSKNVQQSISFVFQVLSGPCSLLYSFQSLQVSSILPHCISRSLLVPVASSSLPCLYSSLAFLLAVFPVPVGPCCLLSFLQSLQVCNCLPHCIISPPWSPAVSLVTRSLLQSIHCILSHQFSHEFHVVSLVT